MPKKKKPAQRYSHTRPRPIKMTPWAFGLLSEITLEEYESQRNQELFNKRIAKILD
jgi:hypothetical protein